MFKEHSNLILSNEERTKLKAEFDKLETIDQKYDFWKNRFDFDYSEHYSLEQLSIEDFKIIPNNPEETKEINKRLYDNYVLIFGSKEDKSPEKYKAEFIEAIINSQNKDERIEHELSKINEYLNGLKYPMPGNRNQMKSSFNKSEWFFIGYNGYLINRKVFDWSEKLYHPKSIIEISLGVEWAKYREFVKNYLRSEKKQEEIVLTGEQKFLILHYLGLGDELKTATQKAKLYEFFIDELKSKSISRLLNDTRDCETERNLNKLIDFFRFIKLDSKARELEDKLAKLRQKQQRK